MFKLDKDKYRKIAKASGAQVALTQLHKDQERWEHETFEGREGWQPKSWEALAEVRELSRELWEKVHNPAAK